MNLTTFQLKFIDYVIDEIVPNLPAVPFNIMGFNLSLSPSLMKFGAGIGTAMSTFKLEKYAPQLKAFGILNEDDMIDIEKLSAAMRQEIAKVGSFKIGDFEFDNADVDKFINYLNK